MARVPKVGEAVLRAVGARTALARAHEHVDLVHGHFLFGVAPAAVRLGRMLGVPVVLTAHGTDVRFLESVLPAARVDEILDAAAQSGRVIAVSEDLARRLENLGVAPEKIEVLPMGVDETVFDVFDKQAARAALGLAQNARIVLFVGRFTEEKGARVLAQALQRIGDRVTAYAAGPADLDTAPLHPLGTLSPEVLAQRLAAADLMCLPSFSEGMPVSVAESLAVGTPVLASRVGGMPEQITPSNGALVEPGDVDGLAAALEAALDATWSPAAIRASSKPFWSSTVNARLTAIYREVLG
jgi:glycosyltransferase involved in cell wall biosynthesis